MRLNLSERENTYNFIHNENGRTARSAWNGSVVWFFGHLDYVVSPVFIPVYTLTGTGRNGKRGKAEEDSDAERVETRGGGGAACS